MSSSNKLPWRGFLLASVAALLFGISAPLAKLWFSEISPLAAAGLIYTSAGLILLMLLLIRRLVWQRWTAVREAPFCRSDLPYLAGSVFFGGMLGTTFLLYGLNHASGMAASLLLNLEMVFTVLIALCFGESLTRQSTFGMLAILGGSLLLAVAPEQAGGTTIIGMLAIVASCFSWGMDNNLTQKIAAKDPLILMFVKAAVAGLINLLLACGTGAAWPSFSETGAAILVGGVCYNLSLICFILALRELGTARTGSLFATAPFVGVITSTFILQEEITWLILVAGGAMASGVGMMVAEDHNHEHVHQPLWHAHRHVHDEHHEHEH
ncbi:MAG: DMT family transporter, partial [Cyanobacteria bacterium NC_groundwater_1444_Ag_S-0.65um_54_12]|nr:DMT family transporter [Cyanobacteria bacterium NC_groundwater_1444_Ag_S-0.65um_54_12]